jgi:hypothetical protein
MTMSTHDDGWRTVHTPKSQGRGKRGQGSQQRRSFQRAARQRQAAWLAAYTDNDTVPLRIRVAELTEVLREEYDRKRREQNQQSIHPKE